MHIHAGRLALPRKRTIAALAATAVLVPTSSALAEDVTVTLEGTALPTISAPVLGDFGTVTLDGTRKAVTTSVGNWSVTDARGTGAGWRVNMEATVPTNTDATPLTLANASIALTAASAVTKADSLNGSAAPTAAGGELMVGGGKTVSAAAVDGGMGVWNFTQAADDLTLTVPSDAKVGTTAYTTTITTTISPSAS
jgi:hypothetical protein